MGVEAQSDDPLFEDDIVCSIRDGQDLWVAPLHQKTELENHLGETATVEPFAALLDRMTQATTLNSVRFEGGYPAGSAVAELNGLGYAVEVPATTMLPSSNSAVVRTA